MIATLLGSPYDNVRARALAAGLRSADQLRTLILEGAPASRRALPSRRLPVGGAVAEEGSGVAREQVAFGLALCRHLPSAGRRLCDTLLERSWLEDLRALCRQAALPGPATVSWQLHESFPGTFPLQELREAKALTTLAVALPPGPYRDLLRKNLRSPERTGDPALLDDGLLLCYWRQVAACCARLPSLQRRQAENVLGRRADIDLFRLLWRARRSSLPPATLRDRFPPLGLGRELSGKHLTTSLFWQRVRRRFPGIFEPPEYGDAAGARSETALLRRLRLELWSLLREAPFGIAGVLAALLLKELEIRDLQAISAGKRYRLPPAEIEELLCCLGR